MPLLVARWLEDSASLYIRRSITLCCSVLRLSGSRIVSSFVYRYRDCELSDTTQELYIYLTVYVTRAASGPRIGMYIVYNYGRILYNYGRILYLTVSERMPRSCNGKTNGGPYKWIWSRGAHESLHTNNLAVSRCVVPRKVQPVDRCAYTHAYAPVHSH